MKTLTIKLPVSVMQLLDNSAQLNPKWVSDFISLYMYYDLQPLNREASRELLVTYSFKVSDDLHKSVKREALENDLSIVEFIRRIFEDNYQV